MRHRLSAVSCLLIMPLATLSARGSDDSVIKRLEDAKTKYADVVTVCHADFLLFLDDREKTARAKGDKDAIDAIAKVRTEFEASKQLPTEAPAILKSRAERAAVKLTRAYEAAIKDYVRAEDDAAATALQKELGVAFRPANAREFDGSYYKVFKEIRSWEEAYARCVQMKGHLVIIKSRDENDFVTRIAKDAGTERVWIGITDKVKEGDWRWVNGDAVIYAKWHRWSATDTEPNDYKGEDYSNLSVSEGGEWHDVPNVNNNSAVQGFVCEWD